jgi:hypothetical protein
MTIIAERERMEWSGITRQQVVDEEKVVIVVTKEMPYS